MVWIAPTGVKVEGPIKVYGTDEEQRQLVEMLVGMGIPRGMIWVQ